tara:strand:- start:367 stop:1173 length:807 start_codon:yes stop_codon:yes gene_type:complete
MNNRPYFITTAIVLLTAVICFRLPPTTATYIKQFFNTIHAPLYSIQKTAKAGGDYLSSQTVSRQTLLKENKDLKNQNNILELQLSRLPSLSRENRELREQLKMRPRIGWNPRLSHIIGRDPSNWWRSIMIDLGSKEGIKLDMPVVAKTGLIGRVEEVFQSRSRVALLGNPNCRISATVTSTGENGILISSGETVFDPTLVKLTHLPGASHVRPGDKIYSSGLGEIFPRDIFIGKILAVDSSPGSLTTKATVKLSTNTSKLHNVWVLMP